VSRKIGIDYRHWAYNCLSKEKRFCLLRRRKHKAEGSFADAANNHGFKKMRFRGIEKATIQNLMIAAIQNLRKLVKFHTLKPAISMRNLGFNAIFIIKNQLFNRQMTITVNLSEYLIFKELFQLSKFKLLFL
jgi:hypothetical protein